LFNDYGSKIKGVALPDCYRIIAELYTIPQKRSISSIYVTPAYIRRVLLNLNWEELHTLDSMKAGSIKIEWIEWLNNLNDTSLLTSLLQFKKANESGDWSDNLTSEQIESLQRGLADLNS